ncbi:MAG: asparagine synthase (glutamine-hydrolyzing) [Nitrospinae bacterium]|nr:asparagine synthase (glutamine-hydrolyzing) [Nitrospinota bacterium]
MCGIVGFINSTSNYSGQQLDGIINEMSRSLAHRGPDDQGSWVEPQAGLAIGHRRLSVLDLSKEGHQPMDSSSGRYCLIFNGEIYNFRQLRDELNKSNATVPWRGDSDTEVLLESIEYWGLEAAVKKCIGMFAFALWDKKNKLLHLVRDRLGIKPLYYSYANNLIIFASELKPFHYHPDFEREIDRNSLALLLQYNYIPTPFSIYKNVYKLKPGTILTFDSKNYNESFPNLISYWSMDQVVEQGLLNPFRESEANIVENLENLLRDSVKLRMISDVPLGAFLSGGIDSSLIVALMQEMGDQPVQTFTIGFSESEYNEADEAKKIAHHLGTNHTELYVSPRQALEVIPKLPQLYDEPFADSSQIPMYLVSELTRKKVTVSLSGDGGDEIFGGYNRYLWGHWAWSRIKRIPLWLRKLTAGGMGCLSPLSWDKIFKNLDFFIPDSYKVQNPGYKLQKFMELLEKNTPEELYGVMISHWKESTNLVNDVVQSPDLIKAGNLWEAIPDFRHQMMYMDTVSCLPDDILTKVDRASMGVSLEARVPLLDHRVVEYAWRIPIEMNFKEGGNKRLLRKILYQYVPAHLIERPKMGFAVPLDDWLRGPLRDWAENFLNEERLLREGFLNPIPIRQRWKEHLSGKRNWQYSLWGVLMFQGWLENEFNK